MKRNILAKTLNESGMCSYVEIIPKARVPLLKFCDKESGISVDVVFDKISGVAGAEMVNVLQRKYPALRPLTIFLKYFLWFRGLNEPFRGGMGSYLLQMLVVHMLQTHPVRTCKRYESVDCEYSLGSWLISFFQLYGTQFNYAELGISTHPQPCFYRKIDMGMTKHD